MYVDPVAYEGGEETTANLPRVARLRVTGGSDRGREFVLREPETSIGRGTMNGIILTDLSVSRRHMLVLFDGRDYRVKDLGSGNGTLVNGEVVQGELPLRDGDTIDIGKTSLRFALPGGATARLSTPPTATPPMPVDVAARQTLPLGTQGLAAAPPPPRRVTVSGSSNAMQAPPSRTRAPRILAFLGAGVVLVAAVFGVVAMVGPRRETRTVAVPIPAPVPIRLEPAPLPVAAAPAMSTPDESKDVEAALSRGDDVAETSPAQALAAYQEALAADEQAGGVHASTIRTKIAAVAPAAAVVHLTAQRYEQARLACDLAAIAGANEDARIGQVRQKLETKARELFLSAQQLQKNKPDEARSLYLRITQMVPDDSLWYTKASGSLR